MSKSCNFLYFSPFHTLGRAASTICTYIHHTHYKKNRIFIVKGKFLFNKYLEMSKINEFIVL